MATLRPFRALRPIPEKASLVSAVPYDVVNREEAAKLALDNPLSFLHVSRPEIDLDAGVDPYSQIVYSKARENLDRLVRIAPLQVEAEPTVYLYRLKQGDHVQTGIAATYSVDEYDQGVIRRHERTRREKEDDRTHHLMALGAQTGPAFLAFRGTDEVSRLVSEGTREKPLFDFTAEDGVTHTLWAVRDPRPFVQAFKSVPRLYIADGHHRTASASRAHAELTRKASPGSATKDAAHAFFLAVAFPAEELRILPYHRVVKDLGGKTPAEFLEAIRGSFEVTEGVQPKPARGEFAMYLEGRWVGLKPKRKAAAAGIASLDVSCLQDVLLQPILGIADPRTDKRIDFVGGIRGPAELERLVNSGLAAVAFAVHATTLEDLMSVSDADEIMPPKSTWFEPKLRDGLLSHPVA
jgi:uncharacterized protein (DUF1015 family)